MTAPAVRVLWIDDHPQLVVAFRRALLRHRILVESAQSIAEAVAMLTADPESFDLVISDFELEDGETGYEALDAIARVDARLRRRAFIFTASSFKQEQLEEAALRGYAIVPKDLSIDELASLVRLRLVQHP